MIESRQLAVGFTKASANDVCVRTVVDDVEKADVFAQLRSLSVAFNDGREWCPAEVFEYLHNNRLLSGAFIRVSWRQPGRHYLSHSR